MKRGLVNKKLLFQVLAKETVLFPAQGIGFDIRQYLQIITLTADDVVMERALPDLKIGKALVDHPAAAHFQKTDRLVYKRAFFA